MSDTITPDSPLAAVLAHLRAATDLELRFVAGQVTVEAAIMDRVLRAAALAPKLLEVLVALHANCTAADEYMRAAEFVIGKANAGIT